MIKSCQEQSHINKRKKFINNQRRSTHILQLPQMRLKTSYAQNAIRRCLKYCSFYTKISAQAAFTTTLSKTKQFIKNLSFHQHFPSQSKIIRKLQTIKMRVRCRTRSQNRVKKRNIWRKKKVESKSISEKIRNLKPSTTAAISAVSVSLISCNSYIIARIN